MSAPVDVLAVMRRAGFHCEGLGSIAQDIIDAGAAVAELIEAANQLEVDTADMYVAGEAPSHEYEDWRASLTRFKAALAKVQP